MPLSETAVQPPAEAGEPLWRVGEVIDGRYEVVAVHEQGAMGVVARVRHRGWGTELAVKSPRPELLRSAAHRKQFVAEAQTWVSLGLHPHVCGCHYVRVLGGVPRVFAEYVSGGSLHEWIQDRRLYQGEAATVLARIVDVAIQVAWGLEHAHSRGVVHQDVKPANILLAVDGESVTAKITDFGLAKVRELVTAPGQDGAPTDSVLVPGGGGLTPAYASPEQEAGEPVGRRSDVYSFAVSVLEMVTGTITWMAGPAAGAALAAHRGGMVDLPTGLADLLGRCLATEPAQRPRSMAQVADELAELYRAMIGVEYPRAAPVAADLRADEHNNRGLSLLDLDRPDEAEQAFAAALAADPRHLPATYNAGLVRWRRGAITDQDLIAAIEDTRTDLGPSWQARQLLAQVQLERGDLTAARGLLDEAVREQPAEPELLAALADLNSGQLADARCVDSRAMDWHADPPARTRLPITLTPDGRLAVTGEADGTVRLWDLHSGQCRQVLDGHNGVVRSVDVSADGTVAVSAGADDTVRFWDVAGGRCLRVITAVIGAVQLSSDGRMAVGSDWYGRFHLWNIHSGQLTRTIATGTGGLKSVKLSADGRWALSAQTGSRPTVTLWELDTGTAHQVLAGHKPGSVASWCFSQDGRFAATGSFDGPIGLWDLRAGRLLRELPQAHAGDSLSLSADSRFLLASRGAYLRLWDLDHARCRWTVVAHPSGVRTAHLSADGRTAISTGADNVVRWWQLPGEYASAYSLSRPRPHAELSRLDAQVDTSVTEAEQAIAAGRFPVALELLERARTVPGHERAPRVLSAWRALSRRAQHAGLRSAWSPGTLSGHSAQVHALDVSADGQLAVSGSRDQTVRLWELDSGRCLRVLSGHRASVQSVCLSADGTRVLSGDWSGVVRVWQVDTGECLHVLPGNVERLRESDPEVGTGPLTLDQTELFFGTAHVRFSADQQHAVVGGVDGRIRLWELASGRLTRTLDGRSAPRRDWDLRIKDLAVSADGRFAVSAGKGAVQLWELAGDGDVQALRAPSRGSSVLGDAVTSVCVSPDGRYVLSSGHDCWCLRLWDARTGAHLRDFDGSSGWAQAISFTADGRFAVSCDGLAVRVWEVASGRCVRVLDDGAQRSSGCMAVTPDGRFVLAGNRQDGTIRRWELDWELAARDPADWDEDARPHLEVFLRRHGPQWTEADFGWLLRRLQDAGFGWLRADGVRAQLHRMADTP